MEQLLKYTRLLFQEQYLKNTSVLECIIMLVKESVYKCTCIPGVAANYILNVSKLCFYCFDGSCCIKWNEKEHRFIAQYRDVSGELYFPNFISEMKECVNVNKVCEKRKKCNLGIEQGVEYAYIELGDNESLLSEYGILNGKYRIEKCLFMAGEKTYDDKEIFRFFSYIVKEYRVIHDMDRYLDMMFRLYLFLFPEEGLRVIEEQCHTTEDEEFFNYNRNLLEEYKEMASKCEKADQKKINQYFTLLSEFLLIDFAKVYANCLRGNLIGDGRTLKELIYKKLKAANAKADSNVLEVMSKLNNFNEISR